MFGRLVILILSCHILNGNCQGPAIRTFDLSSDENAEYVRISLEAHNVARRVHNVSDLVLDPFLSESAKNYSLVLAQRGLLRHSYDRRFGENLFLCCVYQTIPNITSLGLTSTKVFYDEIRKYNYSDPRYTGSTGHFSQIIWKGTSTVGFGMTLSSNNISGYDYQCAWLVSRYQRPGNLVWRSSYINNVLLPDGYPAWSSVSLFKQQSADDDY